MSKITVAASVAEVAAAAPKPKASRTADSGEFKGMLSDAVKSSGNKQDSAPKADNTPKTEPNRTKPEKTVEGKSPAEQKRKPEADLKEAETLAAAEIAATATATAAAKVPEETVEAESLNAVQPVPLEEIRIRPVKTAETGQTTETAEPQVEGAVLTAAQAEANPAQTGAIPAQAEAIQPQAKAKQAQGEAKQPQEGTNPAQSGVKPVQDETEQVRTTRPARNHDAGDGTHRTEAPKERQAPEQHEVGRANQASAAGRGNPHGDTIKTETGKDVESTEILTHPAGIREEAPIRTRPAKMTPQQMEQAQSRFEEMLAKAAKELEQGKTPVTEETVDTAETVPIQTKAEGETPPETAEETETAVKLTQTQETETKQEDKTRTRPAERNNAAKIEKKLEKTFSKADETVLSMVQPSKPEPAVQNTVRTETQTYTQPVREPEQAEQIRTQVIRNLEDGKMEFRMRLNPRELGNIDVKMVLDSGKLAVEIAAASPMSTEILSKQAESLMASLKLNNIEVSYINVVTASANASGDMNSQYNLNSFQNRSGSQEQSGFNRNGGGQSQDNQGQNADDTDTTPQRLLNYQI